MGALPHRFGIVLPSKFASRLATLSRRLARQVALGRPTNVESLIVEDGELGLAIEKLLPRSKVVLSLDRGLLPNAQFHLDVRAGLVHSTNRLVSRSNAPPIPRQMRAIAATSVVLVDSGVKSGWTLDHVERLLYRNKISISKAIFGVAHRPILERLRSGKPYPVLAVHEIPMYEWIEMHDIVQPMLVRKRSFRKKLLGVRLAVSRYRVARLDWRAISEILRSMDPFLIGND